MEFPTCTFNWNNCVALTNPSKRSITLKVELGTRPGAGLPNIQTQNDVLKKQVGDVICQNEQLTSQLGTVDYIQTQNDTLRKQVEEATYQNEQLALQLAAAAHTDNERAILKRQAKEASSQNKQLTAQLAT